MLVAGLGKHACVMLYELSTWTPPWMQGRKLSVLLGKAVVTHQKLNQSDLLPE